MQKARETRTTPQGMEREDDAQEEASTPRQVLVRPVEEFERGRGC